MNCKKAGKDTVKFSPVNNVSLKVLELMKDKDYVKEIEVEGHGVKIVLGKLNFCKSIKPRFNVKKENLDKFIRRFLPSRKMGLLIISTNKGLIAHEEAAEKKIGGRLIAFCY